MQSVAMSRSISSRWSEARRLGLRGIWRRREIGEDVVEVGSAERGGVAAVAADQRDVELKSLRAHGQGVVEIAGGVGKGGEDEDLSVWLAARLVVGFGEPSLR